MQRPCTCDTYVGPEQKWTAGPPNCLLCHHFHTHPGFHAYWDGSDPAVLAMPEPPTPTGIAVVQSPFDEAKWPLKAKVISRLRLPGEAGLGDTVARVLARFGADGMKRLYKAVTGQDCGCGDRQQKLNAMYPYR